jgi:predicted short-subunit dehydrogenase-like oxidoreductase (DUF2520 family)
VDSYDAASVLDASAMLPGMGAKPRIAIVGPGNMGTALTVSLRRAGFTIAAVIGRSKSHRRSQSLAKRVGTRSTADPSTVKADLIWLCVPDSEIANTARALAMKLEWKGKVVFHSSGALTSDELRALRRRGAAVASVHPLMTFVRGSRASLAGVPFAIEGDSRAMRLARRIVRELGGHAYAIRKKDKAAYHAWATFASPLLTALLATTEEVAGIAGVSRKAAVRRMLPILQQTLANYAALGAAGAFSGPIVRGDLETVRTHLVVLRRVPAAREVYAALSRAALQYLPTRNKTSLKRILDLSRH